MANQPVSVYPVPRELGYPEAIQVAAPGAGNNWTYSPDSQYRYRILSIHYLFTASAVAGNRMPGLRWRNRTDTFTLGRLFTDVVTANQARDILWLADSPPKTFASPPDNWLYYRLPFLDFNSEIKIGSVVGDAGIDVGDTFTDITIHIVRWMDQQD